MTAFGSQQRDRYQRRALRTGIVGLILSALGMLLWPTPFLRSYLVAYLFVWGIGVGGLVILMITHLTGGVWGIAVRRLLESASRTLPVLSLLFIPILIGLQKIYVWATPQTGQHAEQFRDHYLSLTWFVVRSIVYFTCWLLLAHFLNRWSRRQDVTGDPLLDDRMRMLSGPGLVICGLTLTFASVDWLMSLQPHWYSTIFSMVFAGGLVLTAMAFAVLLLRLLADQPPLTELVTAKARIDLGNMLLTLVMFWAYVSFSQFLLIWMGNLPEETIWYEPRVAGGWKWVTIFLAVFHFAVPFALLLSRDVKRNLRALAWVACLVLVMRLVALCWQVIPAYEPRGLWAHWPELMALTVTLSGLGGIWLAAFMRELGRLPLVALSHVASREVAPNE